MFYRKFNCDYVGISKKIFSMMLLTSAMSGLTGCGELNSQFTCPMKPGVSCQSLDQVNSLVDQGKLAEAKPTPIPFNDPVLSVNVSHSSADGVTRSTEQVMRLWIAPYQDSQGNYFSSTYVYHVIQPGHWSSDHAIKDNTHA